MEETVALRCVGRSHDFRRVGLGSHARFVGADWYRELNEGSSEAERELQVEERSEPRAGQRSRTA
jgi:hypothetical protein